jgi:hypothetical protein
MAEVHGMLNIYGIMRANGFSALSFLSDPWFVLNICLSCAGI